MQTSGYFFDGTYESAKFYQETVTNVAKRMIDSFKKQEGIYSGNTAKQCQSFVKEWQLLNEPTMFSQLEAEIIEPLLESSLKVNHAEAMAHLHCPVILSSQIAELVINHLNQSMDSWDQSPMASYIEQSLIDWFCTEAFNEKCQSDGIFTSGGTQSNFMGLLLARDHFCKVHCRWNVMDKGLPPEATKFRVLCSEKTHFSVHKSLGLLGLGKNAIVTIKSRENLTLCPDHLQHMLSRLREKGEYPICVVGTAGGTDFGQIDPLSVIADICRKQDVWLHVDAAVGGALLLSKSYKYLLDGIQFANSISIDFHKLFFQSISCGIFLCKNKNDFKLLTFHADYLNPESNPFNAINLVDKSIQTTKRFDALKLYLSLMHAGLDQFSQWITHIINVTREVDKYLRDANDIELAYENGIQTADRLNTLVFRIFDPGVDSEGLNQLQVSIYQSLFLNGRYAIAKTMVGACVFLKLTFVNPLIRPSIAYDCIDAIRELACEHLKIIHSCRENKVIV